MGLCDSYAGVVLNQNALATGSYGNWNNILNGGWVYQTFTLPCDYQRGTLASEQIIPDLAGIQVMVGIDAGYAPAASLDWILQFYPNNSTTWVTLASGTVIGAHADGTKVWYDIIFPTSIPISYGMLLKQFRFGLQGRLAFGQALGVPVDTSAAGGYVINGVGYFASLTDGVPYPITVDNRDAFLLLNNGAVTYSTQQGINSLWYVAPTPLTKASTGQGMVFQSDGVTPLLGHGTTASLNFRLLGMIADSGTDFLNNEYRSVVVQASVGNTSTTNGLNPVSGSGSAPYYLSPPQPSPFSVVSLYADVRPVASTPMYSAVNVIGNPNFEYDKPGALPLWWSAMSSTGVVVDLTVRNTTLPIADPNYTPWAANGSQSLHMDFSFSASGQKCGIQSPIIPINPTTSGNATPISVSVVYNILGTSNSSLFYSVLFYDSTETLISGDTLNFDPAGQGIGTFGQTTTVPANAAYIQYQLQATSTGAGFFDGYIDGIQVTMTPQVLPYFDGDQIGAQWTAQRGLSPSVQVADSGTQNNTVVIDGVMVDPMTPNMAMSVYYSQDDAYTKDQMVESDWEQKLWTRVPRTYLVTQKQNYVFPTPVSAKYMKLEFSDLPAQSYDPGPFQKPVVYKKFPTWVANFFVSTMDVPSFISSQVSVQYDALRFAYEYYLDDLHQLPRKPSAPPQNIANQLTTYFNQSPTGVDATALSQINLVMNTFTQDATSNVDTSSSLGSYVSSLGVSPNTTESSTLPTPDLSTVSTLAREPVIFEQSLPVMYFFVTSRHTYKELTATFDFNRAYFCGVNAMSFLRNDYTVASDTPVYIETGNDAANVELNEWTVGSDGNWYTYAS